MKESSLKNLLKKTEIEKIQAEQHLSKSFDEVEHCKTKIEELTNYLEIYKKEYHTNSKKGTDLMMIQSYTYFINNIRGMVEYWNQQLVQSYAKLEQALTDFHKKDNFDTKLTEKLQVVVKERRALDDKISEQLVNDILVTSNYFFRKTS